MAARTLSREESLGLALAVLGHGALVAWLIIDHPETRPAEPSDVVWTAVMVTFVMYMDFIALGWTGLWTACTVRAPAQAGGAAALRILFIPWVLFFLIMTAVAQFPDVLRGFDDGPLPAFLVWFGLSLGNDIFWIQRSRRCFHERLREQAAERFQPQSGKQGFWRKLLRLKAA